MGNNTKRFEIYHKNVNWYTNDLLVKISTNHKGHKLYLGGTKHP
jgi:hypothetical protein